MTIAACYFSPEAVILGADSTTTLSFFTPMGWYHRHYNHAQKLFAVGRIGEATLGVVTWGLAEVGQFSHRNLIARLNRDLLSRQINSVEDAATVFSQLVWHEYSTVFQQQIALVHSLAAKPIRTAQENAALENCRQQFSMGYCIGGTWWKDHAPCAHEILFDPTLDVPPRPSKLTSGHFKFWGCPNMIDRVLYGIDGSLLEAIKNSPHWKGSPQDLDALVAQAGLYPPDHVPLREAVDFVYAAIYTTIRGFKFSQLPMFCGGPIEIAAITADRPFRWVRHKALDEAIA